VLRLSPDGTKVALFAVDQQADIWIWDLVTRRALTRFTFDPSVDTNPVWTPDGRRLLFSSERAGAHNLYWQAADGKGPVDRLTESPNAQIASDITPDGTRALFYEFRSESGLMLVTLDRSHQVKPLLQTPFIERDGRISPDGRWLAYTADDSGRFEIHV